MPKPRTKTVLPPLFELFTVEQLVLLTTYKYSYLKDMKDHPFRIGPFFRRSISKQLHIPEEQLFGTVKNGYEPATTASN